MPDVFHFWKITSSSARSADVDKQTQTESLTLITPYELFWTIKKYLIVEELLASQVTIRNESDSDFWKTNTKKKEKENGDDGWKVFTKKKKKSWFFFKKKNPKLSWTEQHLKLEPKAWAEMLRSKRHRELHFD